MKQEKLAPAFYQQADVVDLARQLVGKFLCTKIADAPVTAGCITETEAYCGRGDKASHTHNNTRTGRTETMYQAGGCAYIYLCYGIHHLFNIVTNVRDKADAVLIRAIEPVDGIETILSRRNSEKVAPALTAGPGRLSQALGITTELDGASLNSNMIWIEDRGKYVTQKDIVASPRIGVAYAGDDALKPWRFHLNHSKWVSSK